MRHKLLLSMLAFFCQIGGSAWAQTFTQGDLQYTVVEGTNVSVRCANTSISGSIVIPSAVINDNVTYTVTEIPAAAFRNCTAMTALTIPASVETVKRAFLAGCSGLTSLTIKDAEKPLYFQNDYGTYTSVSMYELCTSALDSYYQGRDIERSDAGSNKIVTSAKKIELGGKMTIIPNYYTQNNKTLTELIVNGNITKIGQSSFDGATSLTSVTITAPVDTIYQSAFWGCTALPAIELPQTLKLIGPAVFRNCTSLEALTIPSSVERVCRAFLHNCTALKSLVIEDADTPLYFQNDYGTYTNASMYELCTSALDRYYQGRDIDRSDAGSNKIVTSAKEIEIGGSMTEIPDNYTENDTALTKVIIGGNVTKIHYAAFDENTRLTSVTFNAPVDTIYQSAFWGCTALENIELPNTLKYLGPAVFRNCTSLQALTIPASTEIISRALLHNCTALKSLVIEDAETPLFFQNDYGTYTNASMYELCTSALDRYYQGRDIERTDAGSNKIVTSAQKIELGGNVTEVLDYFTNGNQALTEVFIHGDMNKIGTRAFKDCSNLTSVTFDAPIDTIFFEAFMNCTSLAAIELPATMKRMEAASFRNTALESFTIPANTEYVGRCIFMECNALKKLTLEDSSEPLFFENHWGVYTTGNNELSNADLDEFYMGRDIDRSDVGTNRIITSAKKIELAGDVTAVPHYFTNGNKALEEVSIHGNMTKIGALAFRDCPSLTTVSFDAPIDTIYTEAFMNCSSLPAIELPATVKRIEAATFRNCTAFTAFTIPAATEYVGRCIFMGCQDLKNFTIEDSSEPLYFENHWGVYTTGNSELYAADIEDLYVGRDVTMSESTRLVQKAQRLTFGAPVTTLGTMCNNIGGLTRVTVPWMEPIAIAANAFNNTTYQNATLFVPGGTMEAYKAHVVWSKFLNVEASSYFVTGSASAGGKLMFAGQTVTNGTQKMLIERETDVTFEVAPDENYDFTSLTVNGEAVNVENNTYTYTSLLSDINVTATFTEKPQFDIKATAIDGTVSLNGAAPSESQTIRVYRDKDVMLTFATTEGYRLASVTVNGTDVTAQVRNNTLVLENIQEAKNVQVTFEKYVFAVTVSGGGITVSTTEPKFGENVTVTIEDDPDRTLVSLLVNGQDVTSQVIDGQYIIYNVRGNVTVEGTFKSTKEFITLSGTYATFSCGQDLDFTGSDLSAYIASGFNKATNEVLLTRVLDVPAGTGVFLVGMPGETYKIPYATSSSYYVNLFVPNLQRMEVPATTGNFTNYTYSGQDGIAGFEPIQDKATLLAQTAFLQLPTSFVAPGVKVTIVFEEDIVDGIENFRISDSEDNIYDLSGRKLQKKQKGINIVNGKKVLVK